MKKKSAKAKKPARSKKRAVVKSSVFYAQSKRLGFRLLTAEDEALYCGLFTDAKTLEHVCPPLSTDAALESFRKAVAVTAVMPVKQRISVIVDRATKKAIGIASIKLIDGDKRIAEGGILLQPSAHARRFASEASLALISAAFRRHTIDQLTAQVGVDHKAGLKLVTSSGYVRGADLAAQGIRGPRSSWSMTREFWADNFK